MSKPWEDSRPGTPSLKLCFSSGTAWIDRRNVLKLSPIRVRRGRNMIDNGDVQECFQLALKYFQSREAIYFSFGLRLQVKERRHAAATREQATSAISMGNPPPPLFFFHF